MERSYYVLQQFSQYRVVAHAFSTKLAGNMASGHSSGLANRQRFFDTLGWPTSHCVSMEQVDGTTIAVVSQSDSADIISPQTIDGVDGLLCRDQGVYLVTQTADNLPVLYFDTHLRVIGLAHAGWRGIVGKLPMLMVTAMQRQFGSNPEHILVGIGPCLDLAANQWNAPILQQQLPEWQPYVQANGQSTGVDLVGFVLFQLQQAGILYQNIEVGGICTANHPDFYSAKLGDDSSFLTVIGLKHFNRELVTS